MREILFRGKTIGENPIFVEGFYNHIPKGRFESDEHCIQTLEADGRIGQLFVVDGATVGQYTGLTDKNGKKIFEGDIAISYDLFGHKAHCGVVEWSELFVTWFLGGKSMYGDSIGIYEVIGNMHDDQNV